jgi:hypothetical protein
VRSTRLRPVVSFVVVGPAGGVGELVGLLALVVPAYRADAKAARRGGLPGGVGGNGHPFAVVTATCNRSPVRRPPTIDHLIGQRVYTTPTFHSCRVATIGGVVDQRRKRTLRWSDNRVRGSVWKPACEQGGAGAQSPRALVPPCTSIALRRIRPAMHLASIVLCRTDNRTRSNNGTRVELAAGVSTAQPVMRARLVGPRDHREELACCEFTRFRSSFYPSPDTTAVMQSAR